MSAPTSSTPETIGQGFLKAARHRQPLQGWLDALNGLAITDLRHGLPSDASRIAFWTNCYNAGILMALRENGGSTRPPFFTQKRLAIAGQRLSFDDIEHGILRGGKAKYGLGWVPQLWLSSFSRNMRVQRPDCRVHFALNCGAKSCPPIASYTSEKLEEQLELAARGFLEAETRYDASADAVSVTRLMLWFMGDFGGKPGILRLLKSYGIVPPEASPRLRFEAYDWAIDLNRFKGEW
jgi:hypothetical protein